MAGLIAQGLTNREIAAGLVVTERTAATHIEHILNKLGLRNRAQVTAWAVARGLLDRPNAPAGPPGRPGRLIPYPDPMFGRWRRDPGRSQISGRSDRSGRSKAQNGAAGCGRDERATQARPSSGAGCARIRAAPMMRGGLP